MGTYLCCNRDKSPAIAETMVAMLIKRTCTGKRVVFHSQPATGCLNYQDGLSTCLKQAQPYVCLHTMCLSQLLPASSMNFCCNEPCMNEPEGVYQKHEVNLRQRLAEQTVDWSCVYCMSIPPHLRS